MVIHFPADNPKMSKKFFSLTSRRDKNQVTFKKKTNKRERTFSKDVVNHFSILKSRNQTTILHVIN